MKSRKKIACAVECHMYHLKGFAVILNCSIIVLQPVMAKSTIVICAAMFRLQINCPCVVRNSCFEIPLDFKLPFINLHLETAGQFQGYVDKLNLFS